MAWPDTYWPTFEDGLAHRWQSHKGDRSNKCASDIDCLSPLEKYDMAFNNWRPSKSFFAYKAYDPDECGWTNRPIRKHWDDELYQQRGPAAAENPGNEICHNGVDDSRNGMIDDCTKNGCEFTRGGQPMLARWFGLCHQWVPASILHPEPSHTVTIKTSDGISVPFQPSDVKGLSLTLVYNSIFFSTRCDLEDSEIPRDRFGRIDNQVCRNTNAGAFYVILTNLLGREGRPFAMDRTWDAPVWNQPVVGYEVSDETPFSKAADACKWLGGCSGRGYNWNSKAVSWVAMNLRVDWVAESYPSRFPRLSQVDQFISNSNYRILIELDGKGNVIGGEWKFGEPDHPDFLFLPFEIESLVEKDFEENVDAATIQRLITKSTKPSDNFMTADEVSSDEARLFMATSNSVLGGSGIFDTKFSVAVDAFVVSRVSVQVEVEECQESQLEFTLTIAHGLFSFEKRVIVTNCQPVSVSTHAFSNMRGNGDWRLTLKDASSMVKLVKYSVSVSEK